MKNLFLIAMVFTAACASRASTNYSTQVVQAVEEDARCTGLYQGEGATKTHSTMCRFPNKLIVLCTMSTDKGFECKPLNATPQQPQQQPQPAPAPAPAAAPATK